MWVDLKWFNPSLQAVEDEARHVQVSHQKLQHKTLSPKNILEVFSILNVKPSARNGINDVASKKNSVAYHLPNLHDVIFGNTADDPRLVGIPRKVRYLGRVTTVDKLQKQKFRQLGRAEIYPMRKGVLSRKMTGKGASTITVAANKSGLVCRSEKKKFDTFDPRVAAPAGNTPSFIFLISFSRKNFTIHFQLSSFVSRSTSYFAIESFRGRSVRFADVFAQFFCISIKTNPILSINACLAYKCPESLHLRTR